MSSSLSPREQLVIAIQTNSIEDVRRCIEALSGTRRAFDPAWGLPRAIKYAHPDMVRYMIDGQGASVEDLGPFAVSAAAVEKDGEEDLERVKRTWQVLVDRGWDINCKEPKDGALAVNDNLLSLICNQHALVEWCLSHGAHATEPPDLDPLVAPPLLETVAGKGSVVTFKLLQQHGAQVTRRVLHRAVEAAAFAKTPEKRAERMEMVRYLVEECGCDVNGMDVEQWIAGDCWGTPAAYAVHASGAHGEGAAKVVRWLLEKRADPTIMDCGENYDVFKLAEHGSQKVQETLTEWQKGKERERRTRSKVD